MSEEKPTLDQIRVYLESWGRYPARELGPQSTAWIHAALRAAYEAAAPEVDEPTITMPYKRYLERLEAAVKHGQESRQQAAIERGCWT